jgi:hypothetical protein
MWSRLYRNHVIMPFPSYDTVTNAWAPQADISWCAGPSRESEFVKFPNRFMTEADAVACALQRGEAWIDNRLGRLRSRTGSEHARVIDMIGALKKSLEKVSPRQPPRTQGSIQWHAEKTFTFGQFKSVIVAKSGVKLSEQTLQKSYAALVKLRKNNHWSWAQTRQKVEHSQQDRGAAQAAARQQRSARIPLTERDWRRIG